MTQDERSEATKARILAAALDLFSSRGFEGSSTKSVAAAAGVSEGVIFHHFGSKLGMLRALRTPEHSLSAALEPLIPAYRERPARELAAAVAETFRAIARRDGKLLSLLVMESAKNDELGELFRAQLRRAEAVLAEELQRRALGGEPLALVDPQASARQLVARLLLDFILAGPVGDRGLTELMDDCRRLF